MLALRATATARAQLRALRAANPMLFAQLADRINSLRSDPGNQPGRTFLLDDGTIARLLTFYDVVEQSEVVLVWKVDLADGEGAVHILRVEHVG